MNTRLAGLLRLPEGFNLSNNYPAVVVTGPRLSVKEQAQSVYAERLTMAGFVTLVFDGTYFGESEGMPRQQELPEVKQSDIEGAIDFLTSRPYV
ncbi:MAG: alpha/beta hydrolase, partial [Paludibacteraceae bacterium]|nr:alpha/beta hydrolase [Paludibacteraceae bacterium]